MQWMLVLAASEALNLSRRVESASESTEATAGVGSLVITLREK